ncbi:cell wall hydrolase [Novosphingobium sp. ZW T3_23]|uniref:cell wall hydrolase n=1 Tax=Novosphingobium sp. ZW T3_23 TaxID=3378084 RepID=UPI003852C7B9
MRSKVQWASALALAATVLTTLFGAQGSGAAALAPVLVQAQSNLDPIFVSQPVVQSLPSEDGEEATDAVLADDEADVPVDADTLAQLVAQQSVPGQLSSEMRCLASAIYFESRGETLEGQLAVGRVIINRAESGRFPASYCGVVYQPSQFSFIQGKKMPKVREHSSGWREAVAVAKIAVEKSWKSPVKGALFFHAARVAPNWRLTRLARVDNHIFYR